MARLSSSFPVDLASTLACALLPACCSFVLGALTSYLLVTPATAFIGGLLTQRIVSDIRCVCVRERGQLPPRNDQTEQGSC